MGDPPPEKPPTDAQRRWARFMRLMRFSLPDILVRPKDPRPPLHGRPPTHARVTTTDNLSSPDSPDDGPAPLNRPMAATDFRRDAERKQQQADPPFWRDQFGRPMPPKISTAAPKFHPTLAEVRGYALSIGALGLIGLGAWAAADVSAHLWANFWFIFVALILCVTLGLGLFTLIAPAFGWKPPEPSARTGTAWLAGFLIVLACCATGAAMVIGAWPKPQPPQRPHLPLQMTLTDIKASMVYVQDKAGKMRVGAIISARNDGSDGSFTSVSVSGTLGTKDQYARLTQLLALAHRAVEHPPKKLIPYPFAKGATKRLIVDTTTMTQHEFRQFQNGDYTYYFVGRIIAPPSGTDKRLYPFCGMNMGDVGFILDCPQEVFEVLQR